MSSVCVFMNLELNLERFRRVKRKSSIVNMLRLNDASSSPGHDIRRSFLLHGRLIKMEIVELISLTSCTVLQ